MRIRVATIKKDGKVVGQLDFNTETGNYSKTTNDGGIEVGNAEDLASVLDENEDLSFEDIPVGSKVMVKSLNRQGEVVGYSATDPKKVLVKFQDEETVKGEYFLTEDLEVIEKEKEKIPGQGENI